MWRNWQLIEMSKWISTNFVDTFGCTVQPVLLCRLASLNRYYLIAIVHGRSFISYVRSGCHSPVLCVIVEGESERMWPMSAHLLWQYSMLLFAIHLHMVVCWKNKILSSGFRIGAKWHRAFACDIHYSENIVLLCGLHCHINIMIIWVRT